MERAHPDHSMISSERVKGTNVYSPEKEKIGAVDHLMIDKVSGRVRYAVISFGGFLGLDESHYPVPWQMLTYDTELEGYQTPITEDQLKDSPQFSDDAFGDKQWEEALHKHYQVPPYWAAI